MHNDDHEQPDEREAKDDRVIDLSDARKDRDQKKKADKNSHMPKSWNITYKSDSWGSGDGSKIGPKSAGNRGFQKGGGKSVPFFNFSRIPVLTRLLLLAVLLVHVLVNFILPQDMQMQVLQTFAFIPAVFMGDVQGVSFLRVLSPLSYMFLHADWMHVFMNALMLFAFGAMIEKQFGQRIMLMAFVGGGLAGAAIFGVLYAGQIHHLVGASAGLSALFAMAVCIMVEQMKHMRPDIKPIPYPTIVVIWSVILVVTGMMGRDVAWVSHLAGFFAGVAMTEAFRRGWLR